VQASATGLGLSPATALVALLICNVIAMSSTTMAPALAAALVAFVAVATLRRPKILLIGLAFFVGGLLAFVVPTYADLPDVVGLLAPIGFWTARFTVVIMAGVYVLLTVRPGELSAVLHRARAPRWLSTPCTVMIRFFPHVRREFQAIFEAMSLRGIPVGPRALLLRPQRTLEYFLVPMLVSCSRIADDLTASGLVRGLGSDAKPTPLAEAQFTARDVVAVIVLTGLVALTVSGFDVMPAVP
jgi:energy-coupling factor transport system permease protein